MINEIRHTGIVVIDLELSLHFYRDILGFQIVKQMEETGDYIDNILSLQNVKVTTVKMTSPTGQMIELLKYHSHPSEQKEHEICEIGISHIAFTVNDLDFEYKRLLAKGIQFNSPPQLSPDGYAKVAFCRAPEGTLIELVEVIASPANPRKDYVSIIYNEKNKPYTEYPNKLARYLSSRYKLSKGSKLLDLGCGRGEFLRGFIKCGLKGYGVDQSTIAKSICPEAEILQADIENKPLPYDDNIFDTIFSKSVLEHLYFPEKLVLEIYRILKPGGLVITMVPDWEAVYKTFYEDYTHRTPFTMNSLKDIFLINGFDNVKVEKFRQLPFLWSMPWMGLFCSLVALIAPRSLRPYSKLIRFSQEIMLLSSAIKPNNTL